MNSQCGAWCLLHCSLTFLGRSNCRWTSSETQSRCPWSTFLQICIGAGPPSGFYSSLHLIFLPSSYPSLLCISSLFIHLFPQLAEVYGKLFSIRLGNEKIVFVSGYKMVKEAIVTQANNFVDRPFNAFGDRIYMGQRGVQIMPNFSVLNLANLLNCN